MSLLFVPNRLLWNQWEDFITGGPDGTANPVYPMLSVPGSQSSQYFGPGSLANYLGLPAVKRNSVNQNPYVCSILPFRAYQLIYNEYYRDQNVEEPVVISKGAPLSDDESIANLCTLRTRAWEKDYFTSALPWPQRGSEVSIPLEGSAPVVNSSTSGNPQVQMYEGGRWQTGRNGELSNTGGSLTLPNSAGTGTVKARLYYSNNQLQTDLTQASGVSINDLRRSFALQRWLERNARGGARYIEQILFLILVLGLPMHVFKGLNTLEVDVNLFLFLLLFRLLLLLRIRIRLHWLKWPVMVLVLVR